MHAYRSDYEYVTFDLTGFGLLVGQRSYTNYACQGRDWE